MTNNMRVEEVDIMKGVAIFFTVIVHVLMYIGNEEVIHSTFGYVIDMLGSPPAAPVFMAALGLGVAFSKNNEPLKLFQRGIKMILFGYALNFFRGYLPAALGLLTGLVTPDYLHEVLGYAPVYLLLGVDIFTFAGFAFMALGIVKYFKLKPPMILCLCFLVALISPSLWGMSLNHQGMDYLLSLFVGAQEYIFFPFFPWIIYPFAGYSFGELLKVESNRQSFYAKVLFYGSLTFLVGIGISFFTISTYWGDYYRHGLGGALLMMGFLMIYVSFAYKLKDQLPENFKSLLKFWSKNITVMYVIQWMIIGWTAAILGETFGYGMTILAMAIIFIATHWLTVLWLKGKAKRKEKKSAHKTKAC